MARGAIVVDREPVRERVIEPTAGELRGGSSVIGPGHDHRRQPPPLVVSRWLTAEVVEGMGRFEVDERDVGARVQRAWDTRDGRSVVVERAVSAAPLRQLQAVPRHATLATFKRARDDHRLRAAAVTIRHVNRLVHPAPFELPTPIDEFDVAQAIGSLLDGLAWLHGRGVTHGAVGPMALTTGPTGGKLSLAGAFGQPRGVVAADDIHAASALAFQLLVGDAPHGYADPRLDGCASYAVADAVRAGLHPDPLQRPSAALLATMVRGEFIPVIGALPRRESLATRVAASLHQLVRSCATASAGIGAVVAMAIVIGGLAAANQDNPSIVDAMTSPVDQLVTPAVAVPDAHAAAVPTTTGTLVAVEVPTTTIAPAIVSSPLVAATVSTTTSPPPVTTAAAPPPAPPRTTAAPPPPPPTTSTTTTRATSTTAPTTTKPGKGKEPHNGNNDD